MVSGRISCAADRNFSPSWEDNGAFSSFCDRNVYATLRKKRREKGALRTSREIISARNRRRKVALHLAAAGAQEREREEGGWKETRCAITSRAVYTCRFGNISVASLHLFSLRAILNFSQCAPRRGEKEQHPSRHFIDALNFALHQMRLGGAK
jgi:hypothetical protein